MFSPVEVQLWWGRNGAYVALFFALTAYFMGGDSAVNAFLLPVSAVCSVWTVQRFIGRRSPLAHWWSVSILRWISWGILNLLASLFVLGFIGCALLIFVSSPDYRYFLLSAFAPTLLILARHIIADCRDVRRDFGSITKGAIVLRQSAQKRLRNGCRT